MVDPKQLPDFIIGGAPRAGTTWLREVLAHHPEIYMARPSHPEPKFFLRDELYERGLSYYAHTWFAHAPRESVKGEKSTNYLESSAAAERIRAALPNIKLIFILREPAERAYSNFLWSVANGFEQEDFSTAVRLENLRNEDCPPEQVASRPHAYVSRGMYADLLQTYFDHFEGSQILCTRFEDLVTNPCNIVARIHQFLGVMERQDGISAIAPLNATQSQGSALPPEVIRLKDYFKEANRRLQQLLGPEFEVWQ